MSLMPLEEDNIEDQKQPPSISVHNKCVYCGDPIAKPKRGPTAKTCAKCRRERAKGYDRKYREKQAGECPICGSRKRKNNKYCSKDCMKKSLSDQLTIHKKSVCFVCKRKFKPKREGQRCCGEICAGAYLARCLREGRRVDE